MTENDIPTDKHAEIKVKLKYVAIEDNMDIISVGKNFIVVKYVPNPLRDSSQCKIWIKENND